MNRVQVANSGLDLPDVFLAKRATNIQVKGGDGRAMKDYANPANDNEIKPGVPESRQE